MHVTGGEAGRFQEILLCQWQVQGGKQTSLLVLPLIVVLKVFIFIIILVFVQGQRLNSEELQTDLILHVRLTGASFSDQTITSFYSYVCWNNFSIQSTTLYESLIFTTFLFVPHSDRIIFYRKCFQFQVLYQVLLQSAPTLTKTKTLQEVFQRLPEE